MPPPPRLTAVFDIDGVLADVAHRVHHVASRPKNWAAFFAEAQADALWPEGAAAVRNAQESDLAVAYLTGRPARLRKVTRIWLAAHDLPDAELIMRPDRDRRPARLWKVSALRELQARGANIAYLLDDDPDVIAAVHAAGFSARQATWSLDQEEQATLWSAQERDGRT